ncbi:MAG: outer membrane protein transport protein [Gammaproteobacteria bacterium]|nr:outer membrane protein transport protein [Gammaproteobacteria bacterium]
MKRLSGWLKTASVFTALAFTSTTSATTGYFGLGYGAKSMGLAGATVSNPQDSIAAASNPAGMGLIGERVDVGLRFFSPNERNAELSTTALGASFDVEDRSRRNLYIIPNLGFTKKINDKLWWGISMYGNGGMNTTYDRNLYDETAAVVGAFFAGIPSPPAPAPIPPGPGAAAFLPEGTSTTDFGLPVTNVGTLGVDLAQALIAPTITMQVNQKHTVGASLLIGIQRFSARGLGNFQCFTKTAAADAAAGGPNAASCPMGFAVVKSDSLTNNGNDWSYGAGVRVGWIGEVHPRLTLGVAAASKVYMTEFDDYDELFAEDGDFDIPANFTLGATFKAMPKLDLSFDFQRILYEGVDSISNTGPALGPSIPPGSGPLGTDKGLGFGWEDINVYRIAADYRYSDSWTFRGGFSWNDQPISDDEVLFNILAPAVITKHATLGFTYRPNDSSEWSFAYMHAFKEEVKTSLSPFGVPAEIDMYQNSVDLSYALKF